MPRLISWFTLFKGLFKTFDASKVAPIVLESSEAKQRNLRSRNECIFSSISTFTFILYSV
jgi:hypothetical protein